LQDKRVKTEIDQSMGVLRLPEDLLFPKGSATLTPTGRALVAVAADTLKDVLKCDLAKTAA
jgi:outer membrane protein OmpA-like peptidoglycan-associated protein